MTVLVMTIGAPFDGVTVMVTTGFSMGRTVLLVDARIVLLLVPERLGDKVVFEAITESSGVLVAEVSVVLRSDEKMFELSLVKPPVALSVEVELEPVGKGARFRVVWRDVDESESDRMFVLERSDDEAAVCEFDESARMVSLWYSRSCPVQSW